MEKFIDRVSLYILNQFGNLLDIEIIVPNNRTKNAILTSLKKFVSDICWAPKITPIKDIFTKGSSINQPKDVVLIYELFKVFKENKGEFVSTFDNFYTFGETLLKDFNDIDNYLVNPHQLFEYVTDEKRINEEFNLFKNEDNENLIKILSEFWSNVNKESLIAEKQRTLELWESMPEIYDKFTEALYKKNIGYSGLIYRNYIEKELPTASFESKNYAFVGFSALNKCEKELFNHIKGLTNANCLFFWDIDEYYIKNKHQEAGLFLRENIKQFPMPKDFKPCNTIHNLKERNVKIIEVPSPVAQVKLVPKLLDEFARLGELRGNTAIILGDEKLLLPLISTLPPNEDGDFNYNISMGYPLSFTTSASFVQLIMKLAMHRSGTSDSENIYFNKVDIHNTIQHSFSRNFAKKNSINLNKFIKFLNDSKISFLKTSELEKFTEENDFLGLVEF
ncbi:MAG: hypothetical protein HUK15_03180, partial [Bacteroidales bacterium]|nr:hypothetical protein [Bacteroidales bacterium]